MSASSSRSQDVLDVELCTYALTLVNKTLYEIDDQPTFYDQTDYMEDLGIDRYILRLFLAYVGLKRNQSTLLVTKLKHLN